MHRSGLNQISMIKNKIYFVFLLLGLLLCSCSSEEDPLQLSNSEIMAQQSPWNFKAYELTNRPDSDDSMLTNRAGNRKPNHN